MISTVHCLVCENDAWEKVEREMYDGYLRCCDPSDQGSNCTTKGARYAKEAEKTPYDLQHQSIACAREHACWRATVDYVYMDTRLCGFGQRITAHQFTYRASVLCSHRSRRLA